jgi:hypothetical protein
LLASVVCAKRACCRPNPLPQHQSTSRAPCIERQPRTLAVSKSGQKNRTYLRPQKQQSRRCCHNFRLLGPRGCASGPRTNRLPTPAPLCAGPAPGAKTVMHSDGALRVARPHQVWRGTPINLMSVSTVTLKCSQPHRRRHSEPWLQPPLRPTNPVTCRKLCRVDRAGGAAQRLKRPRRAVDDPSGQRGAAPGGGVAGHCKDVLEACS